MLRRVQLFATTAKGLEPLLVDELRALPCATVEERRAGAMFEGDLATAYRACLWSRIANRILLPLASFPAPDEKALYDGVRTIRWAEHVAGSATIAVDFSTSRSAITHSHFGALKTKDAIVDQLRDERGTRPSVDTERPDVRVNVYLLEDRATVSIDLSGESLHRRGYRHAGGEAPLKENLAAAILAIAGWAERARQGAPFLDPMCGSGTLPIEAALIAGDVAPGIARQRWGFSGWAGHRPSLWLPLVDEAKQRAAAVDGKKLPPIVGHDADPLAVRAAIGNLERAGLRGRVHVERKHLVDNTPIEPRHGEAGGLLVTNPPYGERLGEGAELIPLYRELGDLLRREFTGWTAFVLTGAQELAKEIGLRAARRHVLWNGAIECRLLEFPISSTPVQSDKGPAWRDPNRKRRTKPEAEMFRNRLAKNLKHLRKWAKREDVSCFRAYDADLVEYAVAVDLYEGSAQVQEYQAPSTIDPARAEERLHDAMAIVPEVLEIAPSEVFLKVRRKQRGHAQYEKLDEKAAEREVREAGARFIVNLSDYLDTGLYLDHRRLRAMIAGLAGGRDFLNLFSYTGTATVQAIRGGAKSTTSVDLSHTYLEWARRNFALNGIEGAQHRLVREDVLAWLPVEKRRYGLILLAPPTFSNSKSMEGDLDLQRDHVALLKASGELLTDDGVLLFSNHFRRFKMDEAALAPLAVEKITHQTIPQDFQRDQKIHNSWKITRG
jgi:23S rRNA (guanine2445-N2)-methyltransferase / 23S rRNA (guanine2069-N7)-methyltransferase